ncbi:hypothetical protein [Dyadobacter chenhuakuii]|uniref:GDSL-like lipase/acylhydrolase family protein n=1 Tax=Dyadobacter chenhuakuii TaxID=2909339 RepID=A0ABY4XQ58_9BACT|nr:hypothetical protein [Dyadobacter chenhuakuii]MCF2493434.1 hypothetical protein [Dyadobacter chenhuakuii]USJ32289.1 hypothetical protein NFI80_06000 [Dyadobacter chenhuakuii]
MKKFLNNITGFTTLLVILFSVFIVGSIVSNESLRAKTQYKVSANIDKILIGHSHPECAYNDTIIKNCKNMASSGTSYFYNYYTLKPLLNRNENIKSVFIELTNNQVDSIMTGWIWGNEYLPFKYQLYGPFIDSDGVSLLFDKNPMGLVNGIKKSLRQNIKLIVTSNYSFVENRGAYRYLVKSNVENEIKKLETNKIKATNDMHTSEYNLGYLEKIINYCQSRNVNVYLMRSPIHKKHPMVSNEKLFQKVVKTRFAHVDFLDFKDFPIENSEFGDLGHLNFLGAKRFSHWFNGLIDNGLLLQSNKQKFINDNMNI